MKHHWVVDLSDGAFAVDVYCFKCNKLTRLAECFVDFKGPAFSAYYCKTCFDLLEREREEEDAIGCARCGVPMHTIGYIGELTHVACPRCGRKWQWKKD